MLYHAKEAHIVLCMGIDLMVTDTLYSSYDL